MEWVLWIVGIGLIAVFALAATGALGELRAEDDFDPQLPRVNAALDPSQRRIPLALFGYRRDVVDTLLDEAAERVIAAEAITSREATE